MFWTVELDHPGLLRLKDRVGFGDVEHGEGEAIGRGGGQAREET